jgi:UDP-2,3-diacylglucosamine pyrophosphatase LpxH
MRHTVVISDIHLSEVERGSGLWMRYRQRPFLPDGEIAAMLSAVRRELREGDELTVVLNGDIFDFDAPRVIAGESVFHDLPRTAEHAVPALAAILDDHPVFVDAIGSVLASGHRLVVLSGNHDVVLTLQEVMALLVARLTDAAVGAGAGVRARADVAARITFCPWFHRTPDDIVIEHGHQYDPYCASRAPMAPYHGRPRAIPPTLGSLATRHIAARLGYFNPHDDRSCLLSAWGYAAHWARHYLLSPRSPVLIWIGGVFRVLAQLRRHRHLHHPGHLASPSERRRRREALLAAARQTGAPLLAVARHARLFAEPMGGRILAVIRELWIDRIAVVVTAILLGVLAWFLLPWPLGLVGFFAPVLFLVYERLAPRTPFDQSWLGVGHVAQRIAAIHRARAVIFGHTHAADGRWEENVFLGNSGNWAALLPDTCAEAKKRHVIWLKSDPARPEAGLAGGLYVFQSGNFVARGVREPEP